MFTVKDANGLPVAGFAVTFSVASSGATAVLSSPSAVTNVLGVASVNATAGNVAGSYSVTATLGSMTAFFSLTNLPGGGSDLALGRTATQSSTYPGTAGPSSAIDGNTDGQFFDGSVTATNLDNNAWWQVDLGGSAAISSVVVWNRTDCCGTRLGDYWVFVSNTPFLAGLSQIGGAERHMSAAGGVLDKRFAPIARSSFIDERIGQCRSDGGWSMRGRTGAGAVSTASAD